MELPATLWVFDRLGNEVAAEAFGAQLPLYDIVVASERISGEPTIGATRTGAIFFPAIDFDGSNGAPLTHFMRSTDGGETWVNKSPRMLGVETHPDSNDPYLLGRL